MRVRVRAAQGDVLHVPWSSITAKCVRRVKNKVGGEGGSGLVEKRTFLVYASERSSSQRGFAGMNTHAAIDYVLRV